MLLQELVANHLAEFGIKTYSTSYGLEEARLGLDGDLYVTFDADTDKYHVHRYGGDKLISEAYSTSLWNAFTLVNHCEI